MLDSLTDHMTRRLVPIADIGFGKIARGWFTRGAGESRSDFAARICSHGGKERSAKNKVLKYARAMVAGAEFPPVFLVRSDGELRIDDGFHRVCAAALAGSRMIDAALFDDATDEADKLSRLLFDLEWSRPSPWAALGRAAKVKPGRRRAARFDLDRLVADMSESGTLGFTDQVNRTERCLRGAKSVHVGLPERNGSGLTWFFISATVHGEPKCVAHRVFGGRRIPQDMASTIRKYRAFVVRELEQRGFAVTLPPTVLNG